MTPINFGLSALGKTGRRASGGASYQSKVLGYSPISYFPLNETSGVTAVDLADSNQNGTYVGATLNSTTGADGEPAPFFDGVNDRVFIYSTALRSAFSKDEGTICIWVKPTVRDRYGLAFEIGATSSKNIHLGGSNFSAGGLEWWQRLSSSIVFRKIFDTTSQWNFMSMEWSNAGGFSKCYLDGVFETDLGAPSLWGVSQINAIYTSLGSHDGASSFFLGYLSGAMIFDNPLGATAILDLSVTS